MSSFLLLVSCVALFCGSVEARPIHMEPRSRSVGGLGGSHMNVMLGVRDITNTSATLDWMVPDDKPIVGFKISCKGYANNPAINQFNFDESNSEEADLVERNAPRDVRQLLINRLIPDYNYSCSLLAAKLDEKDPEAPHSWTSMIQPIQFSTLSILTPVSSDNDGSSVLNFMSFRKKYGQKSALIILAGGLPIAAIVACVGVCVAYRKCEAYRRRKTDNYRKVNEQKLDKKLTNVVYNPVAMEYMTKWDQAPRPKSAAGPRVGNNFYSGRYQSPKKIGYSSGGFEKTAVPFGQLSVRDLVLHVEQTRKRSPYYEEFKHNDPVLIGTSPVSLSSSSISVCSSKDSSGAAGVIRMQPVIPNLKLSTPGFDHSDTEHHSRQVKQVRKYGERPNKRAGTRANFSRSRKSNSRSYTKPVMVQPSAEFQNDSILPEFPPCDGITRSQKQ